MGRSNYSGNLGTSGWAYDEYNNLSRKPEQMGVFAFTTSTPIRDISDGTSNTVLFAEIRRGAQPNSDKFDVRIVMPNRWGSGDPSVNLSNLSPPAACNSPTPQNYHFTGLQYQRGFFITALYTHTVPPNYSGMDCIRFPAMDQGHLASRSAHPGGVNVAMSDGSVRFVKQTINLYVWRALGSRKGGEVISADEF
jgi:prepilin-type processing-associated H-X9-DG protein